MSGWARWCSHAAPPEQQNSIEASPNSSPTVNRPPQNALLFSGFPLLSDLPPRNRQRRKPGRPRLVDDQLDLNSRRAYWVAAYLENFPQACVTQAQAIKGLIDLFHNPKSAAEFLAHEGEEALKDMQSVWPKNSSYKYLDGCVSRGKKANPEIAERINGALESKH